MTTRSVKVAPLERGLLTTELAVLMPVMLVLALAAVFVVNVERHASRAQQAADAAARAASLEDSPNDALIAAQRAAEAVCNGPVQLQVPIEFVAPDRDSFTPGSVRIALTCTEPFGGFEPLVENSSRSEVGVAVAVIEYWRSSR